MAVYCDFLLCSATTDGVLIEKKFVLAKPVIDLIPDADTMYEDVLDYFISSRLDSPDSYKHTMDMVVDLLDMISL